MSKKHLPAVPETKANAFNRILRFMTKADITLTASEEGILHRWIYCDTLQRQRQKTHDEIVEEMQTKWCISRFTAENDMVATQRLFARSRAVSKEYLLHTHIENIGLLIQKKGPNVDPKLLDSYTKAVMALPEAETADKMPPPQFIFNLAPGQEITQPLQLEDALNEAAEIIDMEENADGVFEAENDG